MLFYLVHGVIGTAGGYLVIKRFKHLGLLAAGASLTLGSLISMGGETWWPMLASVAAGVLLHRLIGVPIED